MSQCDHSAGVVVVSLGQLETQSRIVEDAALAVELSSDRVPHHATSKAFKASFT